MLTDLPPCGPIRSSRRAVLAASLMLSVLAGCTSMPASTPATAQPASTPSAAPVGLEAVASPLPAPSIDSDLDAASQAAIVDLLDSDSLQAYLPSDLIHDGGVILYQTLAAPSGVRPSPDGETRVAQERPTGASAQPPEAWRRMEVERGGRQLKLRRAAAASDTEASVTVRYPQRGILAYRDAARGAVVRKPFVEIFKRSFKFRLANGAWQLAEISPIKFETQGGNSGIDIVETALYRDGQSEPLSRATGAEGFRNEGELPVAAAGQPLRLEVKAIASSPIFVFAHLAGRSDRNRQQLVDDGTQGDRVAGDGIYTRTFLAPGTAGLRHFGVDAIDARTFAPGGLYRAQGLGVSFRVQ